MEVIDAKTALNWLIEGNLAYIDAEVNHHGDISKEKRRITHKHGQNPFAVIVCCSDSRVIPENIFMKGIGDLFVIRTAGNVIGNFELGSIEYAVEHLGCKLVVVMGHTMCGAVKAAFFDTHKGDVLNIVNEIKNAIGNEDNYLKCVKLNAINSLNKIKESKIINEFSDVKVINSIYHTHSGKVEFLKK